MSLVPGQVLMIRWRITTVRTPAERSEPPGKRTEILKEILYQSSLLVKENNGVNTACLEHTCLAYVVCHLFGEVAFKLLLAQHL